MAESLANSWADLALLVLDPIRPLHSTQTRGMLCNHRQARGRLVLLKQDLGLQVDSFHALVCCMDPEQAAEKKLDEIADIIDSALFKSERDPSPSTNSGFGRKKKGVTSLLPGA